MKGDNQFRFAVIQSIVSLSLVALTVFLCWRFPNAATNPEAGVILSLPDNLVGYVGAKQEISEQEDYWLPKDTSMIKRVYSPQNEFGTDWNSLRSISVSLILSGSDRRSLHRPEVCLDGQGWTIQNRNVERVKIGSKTLDVMVLGLHRSIPQGDGSVLELRGFYVYWWIGRSVTTPHSWKRIMINSLDNMFRNINNRWGYPGVMVYVDPQEADSVHSARERALTFVRDYSKVFQISLNEDKSMMDK